MLGLFRAKKLPDGAVFTFNVWTRVLKIFGSAEEAAAHCPGIEIAEGDWAFFAVDGSPLKAQFSVPARINFDDKTYSSGVYTLKPARGEGETIHAVFPSVSSVEGPAGFRSVADLEKLLGASRAPEKLRA